jgi:eukaryotic-like serine/threonine-protein kinase
MSVADSSAAGSVAPTAAPATPARPTAPPASARSLPAVPEPRDATPRDARPGDLAGPDDTADRYRHGQSPDHAPHAHDTTPASDHRPGKLSLSVAAASGPGDGGRGRRLSCTVALAVAGALAAVTVGSVFVFELLPNHDDDSADSAGHGAYSPAPDASSSAAEGTSPSSTPGPTSVPAAYLGTWEGEGDVLDGSLPAGTFRLTVHKADVGEEVATLRQTDLLGGVCNDVLTLKKVTEKQLVVTSVGAKTNHKGCNPAPHTVRLTPVGDDLEYASESADEGNPQARLSRIKG